MRITKKFAGASCIGKQVFQPTEVFSDGYARELEELEGLRVVFYRRVCDRSGSVPVASGSGSSSGGALSRRHSFSPDDAMDGDTSSAASSFSTNNSNSNSRLGVKFMRDERDGDVASSRHRNEKENGAGRGRSGSGSGAGAGAGVGALPTWYEPFGSSSSSSSSVFQGGKGKGAGRLGLSLSIANATAGIPHRKFIERPAAGVGAGAGAGGIKRVVSAPDLGELRRMQDSSEYEQYGMDALRFPRKRGFQATKLRKRSHSVMDFEQYFDDDHLAGDLLLQFAGIAPAESAEGKQDSEGEDAARDSDNGSISNGPVTKFFGRASKLSRLDNPSSPRFGQGMVRSPHRSPHQQPFSPGAAALAIGSLSAMKAALSDDKESLTSDGGVEEWVSVKDEAPVNGVVIKDECRDGVCGDDEEGAGAELIDQRLAVGGVDYDEGESVGLPLADDAPPLLPSLGSMLKSEH